MLLKGAEIVNKHFESKYIITNLQDLADKLENNDMIADCYNG